MTSLMINLRRSPRTLLARDGHPGPGPGNLALVMGRAGVGKTAFIVGIGIDALLSGQKVLHISLERTVDKIRFWYDDLLGAMLKRENQCKHRTAIQLEIERRRHIQTYMGGTFSVERLKQALDLLSSAMDFAPHVIIIDRVEFTSIDPPTLETLRSIASAAGAELWMACRTHRDDPEPKPGLLPPPAEGFEEFIDIAFRLDPYKNWVRLHILKDQQRMLDEDLNILLNPKTLLLRTGVKR